MLSNARNQEHFPQGQLLSFQFIGLNNFFHGGAVRFGDLPDPLALDGQAQHHRGAAALPSLACSTAATWNVDTVRQWKSRENRTSIPPAAGAANTSPGQVQVQVQ